MAEEIVEEVIRKKKKPKKERDEERMKWQRVYEAIQYCEAQPTYVIGDLEKLILCVMQQTGFTRSKVEYYMEMPGGY